MITLERPSSDARWCVPSAAGEPMAAAAGSTVEARARRSGLATRRAGLRSCGRRRPSSSRSRQPCTRPRRSRMQLGRGQRDADTGREVLLWGRARSLDDRTLAPEDARAGPGARQSSVLERAGGRFSSLRAHSADGLGTSRIYVAQTGASRPSPVARPPVHKTLRRPPPDHCVYPIVGDHMNRLPCQTRANRPCRARPARFATPGISCEAKVRAGAKLPAPLGAWSACLA